MNVWKELDKTRISPDKFIAYIEISKGMKNKYELDKETGLLYMDRILYTSTHYPANYGFIPHTYCDDKDPLDVLVLCSEAILPMTILDCKPIGVLLMTDQNERDEKIIAVPLKDPSYSHFQNIDELPSHIFEEIEHFFTVYKALEGKQTNVKKILGVDAAKDIIRQSIVKFEETFPEYK